MQIQFESFRFSKTKSKSLRGRIFVSFRCKCCINLSRVAQRAVLRFQLNFQMNATRCLRKLGSVERQLATFVRIILRQTTCRGYLSKTFELPSSLSQRFSFVHHSRRNFVAKKCFWRFDSLEVQLSPQIFIFFLRSSRCWSAFPPSTPSRSSSIKPTTTSKLLSDQVGSFSLPHEPSPRWTPTCLVSWSHQRLHDQLSQESTRIHHRGCIPRHQSSDPSSQRQQHVDPSTATLTTTTHLATPSTTVWMTIG